MPRLAFHYYAAMLSAAPIAAALGTASAYSAGSAPLLVDLLAWTGALLLGVNLIGAALLYAPIERHLAGHHAGTEALARRVRALPGLSGAWVFVLAGVVMAGYAAAAHGSWEALAGASGTEIAGELVHAAVFAAYLGLFAYLLVSHFLVRLRRLLWLQGEPLEPRRGRFATRVVVTLFAVALGPALVALTDEWERSMPGQMGAAMMAGASMAAHHHQRYMQQTRHMDVLGALLLSIVLAILVMRGLARPVEALVGAMQKVDRGDLDARLPVAEDDEFGLLAARFNAMLGGLAERDRIRRTFGRFVPESVAAALIADEGAIAPQEREATVLFADLERFTQTAAALAPREIVDLLNAYFDEIARIIHERLGVITQFQGDAVLASFNLPAHDAEHARHALDAALEIQRRLAGMRFGAGIRLQARIGIDTGLVIGGTVGGADRLGYTVHGDTVNLAARLEALNKELGTRILLTARTADLLRGAVPLRAHGAIGVRGFVSPVRVFEPLGEQPAPAAQAGA